MTSEYELAVIDGLKVGARAPILSNESISIGDQIDCDIVLGHLNMLDDANAESVAATRATLQHDIERDVFSLQIVEGEVKLAELTLSAGSTTEVEPGVPVHIAGSTFVLSKIVQASAAPVDESTEIQQDPQTEDIDSDITPKKSSGLIKKAGVAAVICLSIAAGLTYWIDGKYFTVTPHERAAQFVSQVIASPEYAHLSLEQAGNGNIKVVGHVQQRAQLHKLRNSLVGMERMVFIDVSVGEIMAESVASVFRVNKLDAITTSLASGEVLAETATADLELLSKVEAIAYADVAGLKSLEIKNAMPVVAKQPVGNDFETLPGKRIVMVVSTEPTYILTEDGSRYFTGSILPSGHKVKAILAKKVELELDQNTIEVIF